MEILKKIIDFKKENLSEISLEENRRREFPVLSLRKLLEKDEFGLICEIKRASPSAGKINIDIDVEKIAKEYEENGATGISVLTCEPYFQGSIDDLEKVKKVVNIPVLMKDFIIDEKQIYQGFYSGADVILLILKILDDKKLKELCRIIDELGIECIVEVHQKSEIERAMEVIKNWDNKILGINNRNLETLEIDIRKSFDLIKFILKDKITTISESGIKKSEDIEKLKEAGFKGALIGESLMKSERKGEKIKEFINLKGGNYGK